MHEKALERQEDNVLMEIMVQDHGMSVKEARRDRSLSSRASAGRYTAASSPMPPQPRTAAEWARRTHIAHAQQKQPYRHTPQMQERQQQMAMSMGGERRPQTAPPARQQLRAVPLVDYTRQQQKQVFPLQQQQFPPQQQQQFSPQQQQQFSLQQQQQQQFPLQQQQQQFHRRMAARNSCSMRQAHWCRTLLKVWSWCVDHATSTGGTGQPTTTARATPAGAGHPTHAGLPRTMKEVVASTARASTAGSSHRACGSHPMGK